MSRLQFVHITSTGGSAIEAWGRAHGQRWGQRHPFLRDRVKWSDMYWSRGIEYRGSTAPRNMLGRMEAWHAPPAMPVSYTHLTLPTTPYV